MVPAGVLATVQCLHSVKLVQSRLHKEKRVPVVALNAVLKYKVHKCMFSATLWRVANKTAVYIYMLDDLRTS